MIINFSQNCHGSALICMLHDLSSQSDQCMTCLTICMFVSFSFRMNAESITDVGNQLQGTTNELRQQDLDLQLYPNGITDDAAPTCAR